MSDETDGTDPADDDAQATLAAFSSVETPTSADAPEDMATLREDVDELVDLCTGLADTQEKIAEAVVAALEEDGQADEAADAGQPTAETPPERGFQ